MAKVSTTLRRETQQLHWMRLRKGVASSDATVPLGVTTSKAANIPSHAFNISTGMNVVSLRFLADAAGRVATAYVYAVRIAGDVDENDDPVLVGSLALTTGNQVATDGRYYCDQIVATSTWFEDKGLKTADASGANRMARVMFDLLGYQKLFALLDITSGTWGIDIVGL